MSEIRVSAREGRLRLVSPVPCVLAGLAKQILGQRKQDQDSEAGYVPFLRFHTFMLYPSPEIAPHRGTVSISRGDTHIYTQARVDLFTNTIAGAEKSVSCKLWGPTQDTASANVSEAREGRGRRRQSDSIGGSGTGEAEVSNGRGKSPGLAKLGQEA